MTYTSREVVASAARTTTGNSGALVPGGAVSYGAADTIALLHRVTAVTGTSPSMALSVEWSADGTNFVVGEPADTFTAATAAGGAAKEFTIKGSHFRIVWTLTGTTPSFTFSIHELANID